MSIKVNIDGTWKSIDNGSVNIDGIWKPLSKILCNVNGVWKEVWSKSTIGAYQLLADLTLTTIQNAISISGLSISQGEELLLISDINDVYAGTANVYLCFNGVTTKTQYYSERVTSDGTNKPAISINSPSILYTGTARKSLVRSNISITNPSGYIVSHNTTLKDYNLSGYLTIYEAVCSSVFTSSSITSIDITSDISNIFGTGSRFQLYKIGGV